MTAPDRRAILRGGAALLGSGLLAGCDRFPQTAFGRRALQAGEDATLFVQRLLLTPASLAPEYRESDLSPAFRANGTTDPADETYRRLAAHGFSDYRLAIDGLVERPETFSLADLRTRPARTQITRHDCVEGWSCIGGWTGVPLADLLRQVGLKPDARYVVFHCFDAMETTSLEGRSSDDATDTDDASTDSDADDGDDASQGVRYYESIDLTDAFHPQTILAYAMNGAPLPVAHGAPLRLRVERQLGYKMAKYVRRIEVVADFAKLGDGRGGYWEDRGYDWYAGI